MAWRSGAYGMAMEDEIIAYFWEQEDAEAVASRLGGVVRRDRFHGEDDDEDHPWIVVLRAVDAGEAGDVVSEYDGWVARDDTAGEVAGVPLPEAPKRLKNPPGRTRRT